MNDQSAFADNHQCLHSIPVKYVQGVGQLFIWKIFNPYKCKKSKANMGREM